MKLTFRGWKRQMKSHERRLAPVEFKGKHYHAKDIGAPLVWDSKMHAIGKINSLGLSGSFLVEFRFEQAELRSWLLRFAEEEPEAAVRLLAEIQGEAVISLSKGSKSAERT
jgi:hypothetical protein